MRAALALLALASARADLCARGLTASINDKNICCPRMCKYTGVPPAVRVPVESRVSAAVLCC